MRREHPLPLAFLLYAGILFQFLQLLERKGDGPGILAVLLQELVAVGISLALLFLRLGGIEQRFAQFPEL